MHCPALVSAGYSCCDLQTCCSGVSPFCVPLEEEAFLEAGIWILTFLANPNSRDWNPGRNPLGFHGFWESRSRPGQLGSRAGKPDLNRVKPGKSGFRSGSPVSQFGFFGILFSATLRDSIPAKENSCFFRQDTRQSVPLLSRHRYLLYTQFWTCDVKVYYFYLI